LAVAKNPGLAAVVAQFVKILLTSGPAGELHLQFFTVPVVLSTVQVTLGSLAEHTAPIGGHLWPESTSTVAGVPPVFTTWVPLLGQLGNFMSKSRNTHLPSMTSATVISDIIRAVDFTCTAPDVVLSASLCGIDTVALIEP
jgi:hypothetical protein